MRIIETDGEEIGIMIEIILMIMVIIQTVMTITTTYRLHDTIVPVRAPHNITIIHAVTETAADIVPVNVKPSLVVSVEVGFIPLRRP